MSKRYKLIKEYPGSHPIRTISKLDYSKYPEFWEEIVEKDYEVIKYTDGYNTYFKSTHGNFTINMAYFYTEEVLLRKDCKIHSVKRLSDGEVFSVGDRAQTIGKYPHTISGIEIMQKSLTREKKDGIDRIWLSWENSAGGNWLESSEKPKKPLFTTKDGVEIFEGMDYYLVSHDFVVLYCSHHSPTDLTYTLFSTKEAADEYVRDNKPEFSRNQILELIDKLKK